ncbi:MAG: alpha-amylase family glycosyl hydrolase [Fidelibacterota bacterium]
MKVIGRYATLVSLLFITGVRAQVVYWEPPQPWQGGTVSIYYDVIAGTLPDNTAQVFIHLGYNGWTNVVDLPMTYTGTDGWWRFDWVIPDDVTIIDFVFTDGQGNWDNNGGVGVDWHIPVIPGGLWDPVVPNPNDTVTITVNHDMGGNLWWGVNGWTQPINAYWPPGTVLGDPGASVETPLLGPDSLNNYFLRLGPFTAGSQPVEVLDFVFHWNDGTWDNNNFNDYHIPFDFTPLPGDPVITILSHENNDVIDSLETVIFTTDSSVYTEVWIDGNLTYVSTVDGTHSFIWDTTPLALGEHILWFRAQGNSGRVTFTKLTLWKTPPILHAPLPPGISSGVSIQEDSIVTFALLAPNLPFVTLQASWEGWDPDLRVMHYDDSSGVWWLQDTLSPGTYEYMYRLNGQKSIGDPYATDVQWKLNGQEDWHLENQRCRFKVGSTPFPWTDDSWQQPPMEDLIIYELLVRDFTPQGDFSGVISKLDYLQELGINAIELMPVWEFPGGSSWGYNPAFFFAVESSYGSPEDFKTLVNEAHAQGIAVIMDAVFNHCDGTAPYYQLYEQDYDRSPYIHGEQNPWGMPDFDHTKAGTKQLTRDVVRYWMEEYHVDGFRYDNTTGFGWSGLNDYGISVFSYEAWLVNPNVYQIAEHFSSFDDLYSLMSVTKINSHWHDIFHDQMKANLREGSFEGATYGNLPATAQGISYAYHGFDAPRNITNYTESHDEQRVIWEAQTNTTIDYDLAVQKSRLGGTILLTATGVPMLFHGQEFGMDTERTLDPNPLQWSRLDSPVGQSLYQHYKRLLWLRNEYPALRGENCTFFFSTANRTIAYTRWDASDTVMVVANFSRNDKTVEIPFPHQGLWFEFVEDDTLLVTGDQQTLTIPGSQAWVFINNKRWLTTDPGAEVLPQEFALEQNYPNPFNATTTINYTIPKAVRVNLEVYDLQGRLVRQLVSKKQLPGNYVVQWVGDNDVGEKVSSGVYFYRLRTPTQMFNRKCILLR